MFEYKNLLVTTSDDGITTVTINRPKALNALDSQTLDEMKDCFTRLKADAATRAVIITGAGSKAFVAGADLAEMSKLSAAEGMAFSTLGHEVFDMIESLPVPVVAAVNGFALGGGCELALSCDFRYASETASRKSITGSSPVLAGLRDWPVLWAPVLRRKQSIRVLSLMHRKRTASVWSIKSPNRKN